MCFIIICIFLWAQTTQTTTRLIRYLPLQGEKGFVFKLETRSYKVESEIQASFRMRPWNEIPEDKRIKSPCLWHNQVSSLNFLCLSSFLSEFLSERLKLLKSTKYKGRRGIVSPISRIISILYVVLEELMASYQLFFW